VNSLPKTVIRQRRDCDLNPGPTAPESSTLTTRLPRHPKVHGTVSTQHNMQRYCKICYCYYSSSDTISTNKTHNNNIIIMLAISTTILIITRRAKISVYTSGADLGGMTRVTSHPPARQPISCYYCACDKLFRCRFVPLFEPNPSMLTRFARSGSQSHPPVKKILDPPLYLSSVKSYCATKVL